LDKFAGQLFITNATFRFRSGFVLPVIWKLWHICI